MSNMQQFSCDVCGSDDAAAIEVTSFYTKSDPMAVCRVCGFVYARWRPSPPEIAAAWANDVFTDRFDDGHYTARGIPAVRARHVYVAEFIHTTVGLRSMRTVDIGAGEGVFLQLLAEPCYGAVGFGIELSEANCASMKEAGISTFRGQIEDYLSAPETRKHFFDRAVIAWTLENTGSCRAMMTGARALLKDHAYLTVATGSRILVPFKKPLHYFLNPQVASIHPFFFSTNALQNLFTNAGFTIEHVNRYIDTDYLVMIGQAAPTLTRQQLAVDDWQAVIGFFERWHKETQDHYANS